MGCFLGCFRFGDEGKQKYRLFSKPFSWKKREPAVPRNRCSSVASSEEKDTPCEMLEHWIFQEHFDGDDKIHKDLREEAKFLKTCGTILETPAEICKNSVQNLMVSAACCKRINCDQHFHKSSDLPLMIHETIINIENLESCQLGEHDEPKRTVQSEEKDSEVEEVMGSAASETSPTQAEILVPTSSCDSPYPTPLILVDGMQTPGTIYPPKAENIRIGKIRSQFIYPVEDFCQNSFKSKVACENSNFVQSNIRMKGEPPFDVSEIEAAMDVTQEPICSGEICDIERAVIGVVVAQRNEDKTSCVSSKQWVGNGFPNSTSKYKEDQKVSWHATPFEVRLDKVLSDEKLHQQRRTGGRMIELEGKE